MKNGRRAMDTVSVQKTFSYFQETGAFETTEACSNAPCIFIILRLGLIARGICVALKQIYAFSSARVLVVRSHTSAGP